MSKTVIDYRSVEDLIDDTIPDPHDRLLDLYNRLMGNCDEIIQLLADPSDQWQILLKSQLSVLRTMIDDDRETIETHKKLINE